MRRLALIVLLVAIIGAATPAGTTAAATAPPEPVTLTLSPTRTPGGPDGGPTIVVAGTTNAPAGAVLAWEVTLPGCPPIDCFIDGFAKVSRWSTFRKVVPIPWTIAAAASTATVWVAFQTELGTSTHQPKSVIKTYGKAGERITGDQVVDVGGLRRVEVEVRLPDEGGRL